MEGEVLLGQGRAQSLVSHLELQQIETDRYVAKDEVSDWCT